MQMLSTLLFFCLPVPVFTTLCTYDKISQVTENEITEASGLCESRTNPGILYTHNDAGGSNQLYAFHVFSGKDLGHFKIKGLVNNDWEDIACQNGYIYIGDIGNKGIRTIYRVKEAEPGMIKTSTLDVDGKISYLWNEQESETLMVDLQDNIYFVAKVPYSKADVYIIPGTTPMDGRTVVPQKIATLQGETDKKMGPTGGDISQDNKLIIMKTDTNVYLWRRGDGETVSQALTRSPQSLNYKFQLQDEAICFDLRNKGYYTLPEGLDPKLYFHTCSWDV